MDCFLTYTPDHPFPIENLPYGVFTTLRHTTPRIGVAIADSILDLTALSQSEDLFTECGLPSSLFQQPSLNKFIAEQPSSWSSFRRFLQAILSPGSSLATAANKEEYFVDQSDAKMHLPIQVGDYTDYYASLEHATNCGTLIRGKEKALQPNWRHLPVAYHGRASSVVVSGTPFHRPVGQIAPEAGSNVPSISPTKRLDFELEMGFIYGGSSTRLGQRLSPSEASKHLFGVVLLNDWSARDIQTWEYVPLGPFLSKNFCTTISPWIVTCEALEPFKVQAYSHEPALLPYLCDPDGFNYDVTLTLDIQGNEQDGYCQVTNSNLQHTYYTAAQMLAHHTTTGCPMNAGDLLGTGTLSAPRPDGLGSLLEKSEMGRKPFTLKQGGGEERTFLKDGDSVRIRGVARGKGYSIGFGDCEGSVLEAIPIDYP
ncbi:hypothetical protein CBS101457_006901 [Exobasidium rhododendri]|nr:hypothetical protein CBS101457_006901 [Exobasidium rhododendri]